RVPDSDKLDVDRSDAAGTPVRLGLELTVGDGAPEGIAPASATHPIVARACERGTRIILGEAARLDPGLAGCWDPLPSRARARILEGPGLPGDPGRYALLTITPPARASEAFTRDLTVLIDASGSMQGAPLRLAKAVAAGLLRSLGQQDRFELFAFSNEMRIL